jgi:hypothetical protein
MLLWLIDAAGVKPALIVAAKRASLGARSLPGRSKAIREILDV